MTAAEDFASRLRGAASHLAACTSALEVGSERFDLTSSQLSPVFEGSTSAAADLVAAALDEAREKLGGAMSLLTTTADDLRAYTVAVLGSGGPPSGVPPLTTRRDDGLTHPSRSPDPEAVPEGVPEMAPRGSRQLQESLRYQNQAALTLARAGYRVRQVPKREGGPSPDFEIEGRTFDCHTPDQQTPADSVRRSLSRKAKVQASRFILNLDRSGLDATEIRRRMLAMPSRDVREVLVVRNDMVSRIWP